MKEVEVGTATHKMFRYKGKDYSGIDFQKTGLYLFCTRKKGWILYAPAKEDDEESELQMDLFRFVQLAPGFKKFMDIYNSQKLEANGLKNPEKITLVTNQAIAEQTDKLFADYIGSQNEVCNKNGQKLILTQVDTEAFLNPRIKSSINNLANMYNKRLAGIEIN